MSVVLAIVALIVLTGLGLLSVVRKRQTQSVEKQEAHVRSHVGDAQHERSSSRLAGIRSDATESEAEGSTAAPGTLD